MAKKLDANPDEIPGEGHNGPDEATFLKHVRACIAANEQLEEAKNARKAVRNLAKAEGIELKKLDSVVSMSDWAPAEVREHFSTLNRYAMWLGLPVGTQQDLFVGVPDAAKPPMDWEARGLIAATTGKGAYGEAPPDCPADCVQAYLKGVERGTARIASTMGKPELVAA